MAMSLERTRAILDQYLGAEHGDTSMMADDVVFTIMDSGQEYEGPQAVLAMLAYFYEEAFSASARTTNLIVGEGQACLEAQFEGRHIGVYGGIPATGKDVSVPMCVAYDFENDKLVRGRVYFETPALMAQLEAQD